MNLEKNESHSVADSIKEATEVLRQAGIKKQNEKQNEQRRQTASSMVTPSQSIPTALNVKRVVSLLYVNGDECHSPGQKIFLTIP